ncbi:hypothetical protein NQ314_013875 [Rhamnusium bicolor]|uniref:Uncharacterized protein n=1 Tax=Rhamnusium bicolor TaxID=1586634 RepID=A0AAV8X4X5_9CUCU|nr:hypothetical protein NQ314_013875 [Rhamnusium bicolor]
MSTLTEIQQPTSEPCYEPICVKVHVEPKIPLPIMSQLEDESDIERNKYESIETEKGIPIVSTQISKLFTDQTRILERLSGTTLQIKETPCIKQDMYQVTPEKSTDVSKIDYNICEDTTSIQSEIINDAIVSHAKLVSTIALPLEILESQRLETIISLPTEEIIPDKISPRDLDINNIETSVPTTEQEARKIMSEVLEVSKQIRDDVKELKPDLTPTPEGQLITLLPTCSIESKEFLIDGETKSIAEIEAFDITSITKMNKDKENIRSASKTTTKIKFTEDKEKSEMEEIRQIEEKAKKRIETDKKSPIELRMRETEKDKTDVKISQDTTTKKGILDEEAETKFKTEKSLVGQTIERQTTHMQKQVVVLTEKEIERNKIEKAAKEQEENRIKIEFKTSTKKAKERSESDLSPTPTDKLFMKKFEKVTQTAKEIIKEADFVTGLLKQEEQGHVKKDAYCTKVDEDKHTISLYDKTVERITKQKITTKKTDEKQKMPIEESETVTTIEIDFMQEPITETKHDVKEYVETDLSLADKAEILAGDNKSIVAPEITKKIDEKQKTPTEEPEVTKSDGASPTEIEVSKEAISEREPPQRELKERIEKDFSSTEIDKVMAATLTDDEKAVEHFTKEIFLTEITKKLDEKQKISTEEPDVTKSKKSITD